MQARLPPARVARRLRRVESRIYSKFEKRKVAAGNGNFFVYANVL
jgi:hypothetical protein